MTSITTAAVIGAGTMGAGIAQVSALTGASVRLYDAVPGQTEKALANISRSLEDGIQRGKLTDNQKRKALERLHITATLEEAVKGADLCIEAIIEEAAAKKDLFAKMESLAPPAALLASNTSSLSIGDLASVLKRPERFLGMHFFNPVPVMKLVEIVKGPKTSNLTLETSKTFCQNLGKEVIVVNDSPGFATSRLGIVLGLEAIRMVEAGVASPEDIDKAMELGYRHPMGPLRLTDLVGLDIRLHIADYLHQALDSEAFRPPDLLRRMVAEGKLGKKSGQGFYTW